MLLELLSFEDVAMRCRIATDLPGVVGKRVDECAHLWENSIFLGYIDPAKSNAMVFLTPRNYSSHFFKLLYNLARPSQRFNRFYSNAGILCFESAHSTLVDTGHCAPHRWISFFGPVQASLVQPAQDSLRAFFLSSLQASLP